jgi:hypothetical protein
VYNTYTKNDTARIMRRFQSKFQGLAIPYTEITCRTMDRLKQVELLLTHTHTHTQKKGIEM